MVVGEEEEEVVVINYHTHSRAEKGGIEFTKWGDRRERETTLDSTVSAEIADSVCEREVSTDENWLDYL